MNGFIQSRLECQKLYECQSWNSQQLNPGFGHCSDLQSQQCTRLGDSCTDDTREVVQGFSDPRIHFVNLAVNYGNQYGPNNEGMRRARGRYFALLNHDDLWLPDHLEISVNEIEATSADFVFTLSEIVEPSGGLRLSNASPTAKYEPYLVVPASAWLFRRELFQEIGPWSPPEKIYKAPSQDWLYRAWQAKMREFVRGLKGRSEKD